MNKTSLPKTPSFRLDGRRALVAGASSGIGPGCTVALAEAGAHVTLAARSADKLDTFVDAMRSEEFSAEALVLDIVDLKAVTEQLKTEPPFQVMVNSAGMARYGPLDHRRRVFASDPLSFFARSGFDRALDTKQRADHFARDVSALGIRVGTRSADRVADAMAAMD